MNERFNALATGQTFYTTERVCKNNHHPTKRYASTGQCVACMRMRHDKFKKAVSQGRADRAMRYVTVSYRVHRDDKAQLDAMLQALELARGNLAPEVPTVKPEIDACAMYGHTWTNFGRCWACGIDAPPLSAPTTAQLLAKGIEATREKTPCEQGAHDWDNHGYCRACGASR